MKIGVLDFFSGCGGVSAGVKSVEVDGVEYDIVRAIDNDVHCCKTYENMIQTKCEHLDISSLASTPNALDSFVAEMHLEKFDKLLLIGCSPCQGFAAHRKSKKGADARRNLFVDFCTIAARLFPDAVFMENVPDIFSKSHWPFFQKGKAILADAGITLKSRIYNFATLGLPQERFRAIMIGLKDDFDMPFGFLRPHEFKTVRDAIFELPKLSSGEKCKTDSMHTASTHRASTVKLLSQIPKDGGNRPTGVGPACLDKVRESHGGYTDVYGRLAWDKPSVTITARCRTPSCGRFTHPEQDRGLTVREAALLQGFPADYSFLGPFDDKFKQIGNAVPPVAAQFFMKFIALKLIGKFTPGKLIDDGGIDIAGPIGSGFAIKINGIKKKRGSKNAA